MHTSITDKAHRTVVLALYIAVVIVYWKPDCVHSVSVTKFVGSVASSAVTFVIIRVWKILLYHNAMSRVKCIIMRMRMSVHITVVSLWLIYCVPELYDYIMYNMVSLCSKLLLSGESMHRSAMFYSKLTVTDIKPTYNNDETEVFLPYAEMKNCIRSVTRTASDLYFVTTHKI